MLNSKKTKGNVIVVTGPSGVGKGSIISKVLDDLKGIVLSISTTTRSPRPGEKDGVHYYFKSIAEFKELINTGKMLEWAKFADNYYGTFKDTVEKELEIGNDVLLEIDVQGALNVKKQMPEAILIFIYPPSIEELKRRLTGRNTESAEVIQKRLNIALNELKMAEKFDYKIINDNLDNAIKDLEKLILIARNNRSNKQNV